MIFVIEPEDLLNHESLDARDLGMFAIVDPSGAIHLFETKFAAQKAHDAVYLRYNKQVIETDWDKE